MKYLFVERENIASSKVRIDKWGGNQLLTSESWSFSLPKPSPASAALIFCLFSTLLCHLLDQIPSESNRQGLHVLWYFSWCIERQWLVLSALIVVLLPLLAFRWKDSTAARECIYALPRQDLDCKQSGLASMIELYRFTYPTAPVPSVIRRMLGPVKDRNSSSTASRFFSASPPCIKS